MAQFPAAYPPHPPPPPPAAATNPASIIGPQYCAPYPVDLAIVRKVMTITDGNFVVQDINGNILFKVKGTIMTIHDRRVLLDASGNPLVTLRQKIMSAHDRWQVFRGESSDLKDLIFTAKRSSMFQLKTKLDVFLANNTKEDVCDFKVKGSWSERSCVVYAGESDTIVAQMHVKHTVQSVLIGKDKFMILTAHDRWEVFRGDSTDPDDLIFCAKKSSIIQLKTTLDVFLANNKYEGVSDFKVKGSWLEQSCTVYAGESNTIVAQMYKKHSVQSVLFGKNKFMVTVYPNIDYAFIVALIVILDGIDSWDFR